MRNHITGNIYHILSRGVDKRKIFLDDRDHLRFIHDLFEFNDTNPISNINYFFQQNHKSTTKQQYTAIARRYIEPSERKARKLLIELLAFTLMPNHYHLLIKPRFDNGISKFMKRLNMGYARYFNEKYERSGALFEGRYKSIAINTEPHFLHIPYYIHSNPLDLYIPEWRERKIKNHSLAMKFLKQYRWSSFSDYINIKNFPSVTQRDFLLNFYGGTEEYKKYISTWMQDINIEDFKKLTLE